jgi:hypothetical protein
MHRVDNLRCVHAGRYAARPPRREYLWPSFTNQIGVPAADRAATRAAIKERFRFSHDAPERGG